ncbi:Protein CONSERVED IN THE GREEN LINEAGE AND DIATOMS 27, chloroplastic [Cymbomonas tetramitiformis]|uniref:Protein CONSERVED IN THE GREEN LINEAGE AND DIATOMS 27, chloroplastic n=1 Tax=Cymbomonas tetramitiformis TaxID=36881 RepID=A0AAE0LFC6_9CHLO|nr:Protein CONSERVED IN THE GREEN LINEAGE AND DIATOMS 27, chloroplastic [Cymbomonas tetramitiformis]
MQEAVLRQSSLFPHYPTRKAARTICVTRATGDSDNDRPGSSRGRDNYLFALDYDCPIPKDQRPLEEMLELEENDFFSWARLPELELISRLACVWLVGTCVLVPVAAGSYSLQTQALQVGATSGACSLVGLTVLMLRMYSGWDRVNDRLLSATVEYREDGLGDGQIWAKSPEVLSRDRLLSANKMQPVLNRIRGTLLACAIGIVTASSALRFILPAPTTVVDINALPDAQQQQQVEYSGSGAKPYNEDTRLKSREVFKGYASQLDYEDLLRAYEPWELEDGN